MTQTLLHGDCLELLPNLPDSSVDMAFMDLPYAHMVKGKVRKCTANAWDSPIDLDALWVELLRVGKRNAAFVFIATFKFACKLEASQPDLLRYDIAWEKSRATGFLNAKHQPLRKHELILMFSSGKVVYNPQMTTSEAPLRRTRTRKGHSPNYGSHTRISTEETGLRYPNSVLRIPVDCSQDTVHPTQKPVALLEWLIRTYSNPGDTVIDPTCGSGTTLVACQNTGRHGIGIEKDATYYAIAQRRLAEHQPPLPGAA